ncbi:MAG TPA: helix-hairpin-helix domain-containing protein [Candidatus Eisenbacteria bacterium]|nr:helix-hairpin-helix domain-containing protein [Candidatus Eisenbacteria bacterium]
MPVLTPDERRGLAVIAIVAALGAARDLWQARHPARVPPLAAESMAARAGSAPAPEPPPADSARPGVVRDTVARLDLNRASARELDDLPGIGPVLAARIVAERVRRGRFERVEDLLAVPGIGPKLFARMRLRVEVRSASGAR